MPQHIIQVVHLMRLGSYGWTRGQAWANGKEPESRKARCSGTTDNLMIDRMVTLDCHRNKAYDRVDHNWLKKIMWLHKFPKWICEVVGELSDSWNTKIAARTVKSSISIRFNRSLPQGDALCLHLFILCINPVAWKLNSAEGYRLSKTCFQGHQSPLRRWS